MFSDVRKSRALFEDYQASSSFVLLKFKFPTKNLTVFKYYVELIHPNHILNAYSPYHCKWIPKPQIPSSSTNAILIMNVLRHFAVL